ncbi:hypothetical protein GOP47_0009057 [Adiantum capillus-veneris]|uniref:Uncharacterized protein n=1 Tax=Adiantum capillus-veneris TaxID=13818 RepID=A0A9D4V0Z3_ADICA|nr:hypothetical protein GOP47_0009057 [Adiantum capillus-veneris]
MALVANNQQLQLPRPHGLGGKNSCGKVYNTLKSENPTLYERLRSSQSLTLPEILYCKRPISGSPVNHDFLVLHLGDNGEDHYYVLAEKREEGIFIKWYSRPDSVSASLDCKGGPVGLVNVERNLESFDPCYDLESSNCKHYARDIAKKLINAMPNLSDDEKKVECDKVDDIPWL